MKNLERKFGQKMENNDSIETLKIPVVHMVCALDNNITGFLQILKQKTALIR
jgi:hypothetical protein